MRTARRAMTLIETAVAIALAVTLYLALETMLGQQRRLAAFAQERVSTRETAVAAARELLADPAARERLERDGFAGLSVRIAVAPLPGAQLARVTVTGPRGSDTVQVVLLE